MRPPWAVLCDFDGTATLEDIGDQVSIRFAGHEVWRRAEDEYLAGAFSFGVLLARIFEPITASREEIGAFARSVAVFRPGFERLVAACRASGAPFVLCSAGLDVYIEPVLERLPAELRDHVTLRANRAIPSPNGLRVEFPGAGSGCGRCGSCKGAVVEELRAAGYKVVAVGDGTADRCAAEAADFVFARRRLVDWCEAKGIPHTRFETFDEVMEGFPHGGGAFS